jgi:pimeloyl-ACP methyl ester carboxylesterase
MDHELQSRRSGGRNKAAIVLIHGFGGDIRDTWKYFPQLLQDDPSLQEWDIWMLGYPTQLRVDLVGLWTGNPDLRKVALRVATDATHSELGKYKTLGLIAHSMGGLVAQRALLDDPALLQRTSHLILFGTPSGGLLKASLARLLKPQLRDMGRSGAFITSLRSDWDARFAARQGKRLPFRFMAIAGESDEFVPSASAVAPFPEADYPGSVACVRGNHVEIVKPDKANHPSVNIVRKLLRGEAAPAGPWNSARVAIELNDFNSAIAVLEPHAKELDAQAAVQLAIALDSVGRREQAVRLLQDARTCGTTDAMGTLAGRYKRRWLAERRDADAQAAYQLYSQALEQARTKGDAAQCYYLGINVAFLDLAYRQDAQAANRTAKQVLQDCSAAAAAGGEKPSDRMWRRATEAEAQLMQNKATAALALYKAVLEAQPEPWQIKSMYQQALHLAKVLQDAALEKGLQDLFGQGEN